MEEAHAGRKREISMVDKLWDEFSTVIKMNDKVVGQAAAMAPQQVKIEDLTARVIRLETALEIALSARGGCAQATCTA
jgi:hypothetical protein